jgi:hypothetical protein
VGGGDVGRVVWGARRWCEGDGAARGWRTAHRRWRKCCAIVEGVERVEGPNETLQVLWGKKIGDETLNVLY